jgi:PhnB protein
MMQLNAYLTFNGNCREAMTFYADCLGGELHFQTIGQSPLSDKLPAKMKDCILHARLATVNFVLMGSDISSDTGILRGNTISLFLNCESEEKIRTTFTKLAKGGIEKQPLEHSFWGALSGDLTDRFGNNWLLHYNENQHL